RQVYFSTYFIFVHFFRLWFQKYKIIRCSEEVSFSFYRSDNGKFRSGNGFLFPLFLRIYSSFYCPEPALSHYPEAEYSECQLIPVSDPAVGFSLRLLCDNRYFGSSSRRRKCKHLRHL